MPTLQFTLQDQPLAIAIDTLIVAGWTGRDPEAIEHHIQELEEIGVARPRSVPTFYRLGANLLTTDEHLDFTGPDSSGEAEFVLLSTPAGLLVGVGSDHTDRKVEAYGVTVSKQMCPKPISKTLWRYSELKDHWDELILRSYVTRNGTRELYQQGPVTRMLAPESLIAKLLGPGKELPIGTAMFCGTLPVIGNIGGGDRFEVQLEDPTRKRTLSHTYTSRILPFAD